MQARKRDILAKLSIVEMTQELRHAMDQENALAKKRLAKLSSERQFRKKLRKGGSVDYFSPQNCC